VNREFIKISNCISSCEKRVHFETCEKMIDFFHFKFCKKNKEEDLSKKLLSNLIRKLQSAKESFNIYN
jgi:hypothetical protein